MAGAVSRESYIETGLEVLSDLGYGGLKLAEVCNRLGVTTGSFYHYFTSWSAYTRDMVAHWVQVRTVASAEAVRAEADPRRRVDLLIQEALALPHGAEAAIRVWSSIDRDVQAVQA
ncbi:MAG: helix-turn-helix domain-containing protein, partial [Rhodococcus fascians]